VVSYWPTVLRGMLLFPLRVIQGLLTVLYVSGKGR
jgi:hypothetical protein